MYMSHSGMRYFLLKRESSYKRAGLLVFDTFRRILFIWREPNEKKTDARICWERILFWVHIFWDMMCSKDPQKEPYIRTFLFQKKLFGEGALLGAGFLTFDTFKRAIHSRWKMPSGTFLLFYEKSHITRILLQKWVLLQKREPLWQGSHGRVEAGIVPGDKFYETRRVCIWCILCKVPFDQFYESSPVRNCEATVLNSNQYGFEQIDPQERVLNYCFQ